MNIKPSFYIIGERKCASSSFYRYLLEHQEILPCQVKEPQFFSQAKNVIQENIKDYFSLYPSLEYQGDIVFEWPELNKTGKLIHEKITIERNPEISYITGEASANTFSEVEPGLLFEYLPDIHLIVIMRDPIERAFSHHKMFLRFQNEGRDLAFKVNDFLTDIKNEISKIGQEGFLGEFVEPGLYLKNLKKWHSIYPKSQFTILQSKALSNPIELKSILADTCRKLSISPYQDFNFIDRKFNVAPKSEIPKEAKNLLKSYYKVHNEALANYLGNDLYWT